MLEGPELHPHSNLAAWDRVLRVLAGAALALGAPLLLSNHPYWIALLAVLGGVQLVTAVNGY